MGKPFLPSSLLNKGERSRKVPGVRHRVMLPQPAIVDGGIVRADAPIIALPYSFLDTGVGGQGREWAIWTRAETWAGAMSLSWKSGQVVHHWQGRA